ncbi:MULTISPECIES: LysE/ArgO family amino acid transporter [Thalassospira]|jgi:L-lysine exporter family protein LysE/ArgO|uniref:Amino acid transporter n=2 Tax=Thalassospira TaxID=168934 RepID=A0ABR5XXM4_9PROT|nr:MULTISPECIES: LysE/ArgO family amino acid transporter [Thalassospira]MAL30798.1 amino acid transporter [Thalassospira sp.]MBR9779894.1 amino acid transporter [Rhodospirillales bacterium]KZC97227.1 amino acid transporter [Thalassospira xiamenensis]KZD10180.1 amino acid transporter [Thalassospira xiamenensis]MBL4839336.1 amino acid transporter [Thalassospira sp.]|tara:strand:- start:24358 stop:24984 length:627 start_codon:yes stop_codon:yes gene_type:complete
MLLTFATGFGLGGGLIIAIGAQNAFVLGQGLRRNHPVMVAFVCALCDTILIAAGVAGLGTLVATYPILTKIATWGGAAFLIWYGFAALRRLFETETLSESDVRQAGWKAVLSTALAVTLLNPHVYLDTVVMLGGIGGQFPADERLTFALGAMSASFVWFFAIALGAAWLAPYVARPITWKIIDGVTCAVMWLVAYTLIAPEITSLIYS